MTVNGRASRERGSGRKLRDQLFGRNDGMSVGRPVDGMGGVHCLLAEGGGGVLDQGVVRMPYLILNVKEYVWHPNTGTYKAPWIP